MGLQSHRELVEASPRRHLVRPHNATTAVAGAAVIDNWTPAVARWEDRIEILIVEGVFPVFIFLFFCTTAEDVKPPNSTGDLGAAILSFLDAAAWVLAR